VGRRFFPLDERLALLSSHFSPFLVECMVRLGTLLPFEQVPALLAFLTGVHVSADTVRRLTERAGAAQVAIERRELEQLEQELPEVPAGPARQEVSTDGAMIPLLGGQWAEVRTLALGVLDPPSEQRAAGDDEEARVHAHAIRYFSRLCSAHDFIRQAALPCYQRGVARAEVVVAVTDGADWIQELLDAHCREAVRILDFPHAAGYVADVAKAAFGPGTREAAIWLSTWLHELKHGTLNKVLAAIRALPMPSPEAEAVRETTLAYLTKRRAQLAYATFREHGYPIGSGMVESANKLVVEARLKGSGMHWHRDHVTPMLALRGLCCSGIWDTAWVGIWSELRRQTAHARHERRQTRAANRADADAPSPPEGETAIPPAEPEDVAPEDLVSGDDTANEPWRPPPDHPWRRPFDPELLERATARQAQATARL
jgi:hypothetical protein